MDYLSGMGGGNCASGALAAGFTKALAPTIDGIDAANSGPNIYRTFAAAIVGGTASVLGGGKFENGAITGAFSRIFNDEAMVRQPGDCVTAECAAGLLPEREIRSVKEDTQVLIGTVSYVLTGISLATPLAPAGVVASRIDTALSVVDTAISGDYSGAIASQTGGAATTAVLVKYGVPIEWAARAGIVVDKAIGTIMGN
jgi:hypothetical protein